MRGSEAIRKRNGGAPWMKNYLLASARYDHGEGGAGKPGTDAVYGGHSHVGTMIYLGDNWPTSYRNHLFTHNLHGHQINHQINVRDQGGFNPQHAGQDMRCSPIDSTSVWTRSMDPMALFTSVTGTILDTAITRTRNSGPEAMVACIE